ncbi:hypothetical protein FOA52_000129 [Chlamydomonas sp. UWO 241]|nr:hypothetical protein FOA52_000129 [Chlamydomonas sp. UWO 241]
MHAVGRCCLHANNQHSPHTTAMAMSAAGEKFSIPSNIKDSIDLLRSHTDPKHADRDAAIPPWVFQKARGIAFLFTYKVGVFASVSGGSGILICKKPGTEAPEGAALRARQNAASQRPAALRAGPAKRPEILRKHEWGLPIGVGLGGGGGGLDFGVSKSLQMIVLNNDDAAGVRTFATNNAKLDIGIAFAAGPVGRQAEGAAAVGGGHKITPCFTYGYTKGLFSGVGIQGMFVTAKDKENAHYYGLPVPVSGADLLFGPTLLGTTPTPEVAELHAALALALQQTGPGTA